MFHLNSIELKLEKKIKTAVDGDRDYPMLSMPFPICPTKIRRRSCFKGIDAMGLQYSTSKIESRCKKTV